MITDLFERQCGGKGPRSKVKHRSYRDARKARRAMKLESGDRYDIYRCPWCGFLHVGHTNRNATRSAEADESQRERQPMGYNASLEGAS